ncbi:MAG: stage II sporulation protein M [Desulfotomaculaceae bacterium]|nr:stage II sporulation protein M [Desulfotomaculaceae bacterium]MDD4766058.1 stage II sporulation protein M [Desulfotomaculaceae bacterium]
MGNRFLVLWASSLRQSWPAYLVILLLFTLGIAAGALGVQRLQADQAQELSIYLDQFMMQAGVIEVDTVKALQDVLYSDLVVILAIYLLGLTVIGIPVILGIIFTRGFVLGYTVSFLASEKGIQGIALVCAAVLPQNLIFIPALLLAGVASLSFAVLLARRFNNSKFIVWPSFVGYSGLTVVVLACTAAAGLVEVYFTPFLVKLAANYIF